MKKTIQFLFLSFIIVLGACNKDDINNTDTKIGRSRVTFFPVVTLLGERYMAVEVGGQYTEEGIEATESGEPIPYTTTGTVNTAVPGVYTLTYSAENKDGFSAVVKRTVAVYDTDPDAAAHDLSGNYARDLNGSIAEWTRLAPGVYQVFNPGGAPGTNVTVIVINPNGYVIDMPEQEIGDGSLMSSAQEVFTAGAVPKYTWQILNPGYGDALRTFVKQ